MSLGVIVSIAGIAINVPLFANDPPPLAPNFDRAVVVVSPTTDVVNIGNGKVRIGLGAASPRLQTSDLVAKRWSSGAWRDVAVVSKPKWLANQVDIEGDTGWYSLAVRVSSPTRSLSSHGLAMISSSPTKLFSWGLNSYGELGLLGAGAPWKNPTPYYNDKSRRRLSNVWRFGSLGASIDRAWVTSRDASLMGANAGDSLVGMGRGWTSAPRLVSVVAGRNISGVLDDSGRIWVWGKVDTQILTNRTPKWDAITGPVPVMYENVSPVVGVFSRMSGDSSSLITVRSNCSVDEFTGGGRTPLNIGCPTRGLAGGTNYILGLSPPDSAKKFKLIGIGSDVLVSNPMQAPGVGPWEFPENFFDTAIYLAPTMILGGDRFALAKVVLKSNPEKSVWVGWGTNDSMVLSNDTSKKEIRIPVVVSDVNGAIAVGRKHILRLVNGDGVTWGVEARGVNSYKQASSYTNQAYHGWLAVTSPFCSVRGTEILAGINSSVIMNGDKFIRWGYMELEGGSPGMYFYPNYLDAPVDSPDEGLNGGRDMFWVAWPHPGDTVGPNSGPVRYYSRTSGALGVTAGQKMMDQAIDCPGNSLYCYIKVESPAYIGNPPVIHSHWIPVFRDNVPPDLSPVSPLPYDSIPGPSGRNVRVTYKQDGVVRAQEVQLSCGQNGVNCNVQVGAQDKFGNSSTLIIPLRLVSRDSLIRRVSQNASRFTFGGLDSLRIEVDLLLPSICSLRIWSTMNRWQEIATLQLGGANRGVNRFTWDGEIPNGRLGDGNYGLSVIIDNGVWRDSLTSYISLEDSSREQIISRSTFTSRAFMQISLNTESLSLVRFFALIDDQEVVLGAPRILPPGESRELIYNVDHSRNSLAVKSNQIYRIFKELRKVPIGLQVVGSGPSRSLGSTRWNPFLSQVIATSHNSLAGVRDSTNLLCLESGNVATGIGSQTQIISPLPTWESYGVGFLLHQYTGLDFALSSVRQNQMIYPIVR